MKEYERMKKFLVDGFEAKLDSLSPREMQRFLNQVLDDEIIDVSEKDIPNFVFTCDKCEKYYGKCMDEQCAPGVDPEQIYVICSDPVKTREEAISEYQEGIRRRNPYEIQYVTQEEMDKISPCQCPIVFRKYYGLEEQALTTQKEG